MTRTTSTTIQQAIQIYQASSTSSPKNNKNTAANNSKVLLLSEKKNDTTSSWIAEPSFHQTRNVLGTSFAGTNSIPGEPISDWAFNHMGDWFYDNNKKQYADGMKFGMGFPTYAAKKNNRAFIISKQSSSDSTNKQDDDENNSIISAAIIVEYDYREQGTMMYKFLENWRYFKAFWAMTMKDPIPEIFSNKNKKHKAESRHFEKKIKHFESSIKKWHQEEGPRELHWYVQCVGVSPKYSHGKGMGRDLMEKVGALADQVGMACYLESGDRNRGFYEKMGYRVLACKQIADPTDSSKEPATIFTMIRPASSSSHI